MNANVKNNFYLVVALTKRNVKLFLKDKVAVFFSIFAALIVLLLYLLFLKKVQLDSLTSAFPERTVPENLLGSFMDAWMLAGAMSVSCITVTLSANNVMIQDKSRGILMDCYSAPIRRGLVQVGYFIGNVIVSGAICLLVLLLALVYLACTGGFFLSVAECFALVGTTLLSVLSAAGIMTLIASFLKTESSLGGFVGIVSAAIGFLIGAFMPIAAFPKGVQYAVGLIPGTYSAGLFRNFFMQSALNEIGAYLPSEAIDSIAGAYSMKIDLFGLDVSMTAMAIVLALSFVVFTGLFIFKAANDKKTLIAAGKPKINKSK